MENPQKLLSWNMTLVFFRPDLLTFQFIIFKNKQGKKRKQNKSPPLHTPLFSRFHYLDSYSFPFFFERVKIMPFYPSKLSEFIEFFFSVMQYCPTVLAVTSVFPLFPPPPSILIFYNPNNVPNLFHFLSCFLEILGDVQLATPVPSISFRWATFILWGTLDLMKVMTVT